MNHEKGLIRLIFKWNSVYIIKIFIDKIHKIQM